MGAKRVERPELIDTRTDRYYEPTNEFEASCKRLGYVPTGINEQIDLVAAGMARARSSSELRK
ncbi:MAG: hypothetical protein HQ526_02590 [Actinobacteria bacterium]|nr:hypothetical protein [Actinomycetota bacterium]